MRSAGTVLSSRATIPAVIGIFLLVYIGIAFFTEDALIMLMELTRRNLILVSLLALLPLNVVGRIVTEARAYLQRRRAVSGDGGDVSGSLFSDSVEVTVPPSFPGLQEALGSLGYKTSQTEQLLFAWKGSTIFPARLLFLLGMFCLFTGIFISLTTRTSYREPVVEGVPFPAPLRNGGVVERIRLEKSSGKILSQQLKMDVAPSAQGDARSSFGIYPPGLYQGAFVYPRYLGVALFVRFSAPDLQGGFEKHAVLDIYPAGKEAAVEIPESPYRIMLSLVEPGDGTDPFVTGRMDFMFKLVKGKDVLYTGNVPGGGEFIRDGYRVAFPDFRRMVITDFIQDYGVYCIWIAAALFCISLLFWLPVRWLLPRREMLFVVNGTDGLRAYSRAEGQERVHNGAFSKSLDMLTRIATKETE
jgi:hypothetical protein